MTAPRPRAQADRPAKALGTRPDRWVLTAVEFDVLWEWLRLGATPVVLRMDSPGHCGAARARIVGSGWQALRERSLADASGPHPELVRLLNLLARPAAQLELRMWRGHGMRAVTAGRGNSSALAVRQDETVTLSACTELASALIDVLPPAPAGPGRAVTVPTAVIDSDAGRPHAAAQDDRMLELVLRRSDGRTHRAQVAALAADRCGMLRRLPKIVGILDTAAGRYQLTKTTTADGEERTTLAPAHGEQLRERAADLLAEAREAAARIS